MLLPAEDADLLVAAALLHDVCGHLFPDELEEVAGRLERAAPFGLHPASPSGY
jgi:HD superfamily phosphodiesterase